MLAFYFGVLMSGYLYSLLGSVSVYERHGIIFIDGIKSKQYINELMAIWKTSKIRDHMFIRIGGASISFYSFFLPDVLYTLKTIVANPRPRSAMNYRLIRKIIDEIEQNTWISRLNQKLPDIIDINELDQLTVKLYEHQLDYIHFYNDIVPKYGLLGHMLAAKAGTGKTLNTIGLALCLKADVTICIVPKASIQTVWEATVTSCFKKPKSYWSSASGEPLTPGKDFYLCHYESMEELSDFLRGQKYNNPVVIVDESHNFNNLGSDRTQFLVKLSRIVLHAKHVVWASGTPLKAIGSEAIPFLLSVDPLFTADVAERFKKIYGATSSRAADILSHRIGYMAFKVEKKDVVGNQVDYFNKNVSIPNGQLYTLETVREDMRKFVSLRHEYYRSNFYKYEENYNKGLEVFEKTIGGDIVLQGKFDEYRRYIAQIRAGFDASTMKDIALYCNNFEKKEILPVLKGQLKEDFKSAKSVVKYVDLKIRGEALGRVLGKLRVQCHVDMVPHMGLTEEIDQAVKKTVIFTSYVEVADKIFQHLSKEGYKPLIVYGATNNNLNSIVEKFDKDEDANPLIATFQSLSTAVPLVMASTVILTNSPFRPHEHEQSVSRLDRLGQDSPVTVVNIFLDTNGEPNISTRSADIMNWAKEMVDILMGHKTIDLEDDEETLQTTLEEYYEGMPQYLDPNTESVLDRW